MLEMPALVLLWCSMAMPASGEAAPCEAILGRGGQGQVDRALLLARRGGAGPGPLDHHGRRRSRGEKQADGREDEAVHGHSRLKVATSTSR